MAAKPLVEYHPNTNANASRRTVVRHSRPPKNVHPTRTRKDCLQGLVLLLQVTNFTGRGWAQCAPEIDFSMANSWSAAYRRAPRGRRENIWISKFSPGFPNPYLASRWNISGLDIWRSKEFRRISKFLFGGFVEYQALAVEKIWKTSNLGW
jgi:hypothetical protein